MAEKYSLWVMPSGKTKRELEDVIRVLAKRQGGLAFEPHITLLHDVEGTRVDVLRKVEQLSRLISPYAISFSTIASDKSFWKCVFLQAEENNIVPNATARKVFGREEDPPYATHLSLFYGMLPEERREEIRLAAQELLALPITFTADAIHVYPAAFPIENWKRIEVFPLRQA
jgi:hypothetical protein